MFKLTRLAAAAMVTIAMLAGCAPVHHPPAAASHTARACLTVPGGMFHRPMGAGSLAWMETLVFVPRCAS